MIRQLLFICVGFRLPLWEGGHVRRSRRVDEDLGLIITIPKAIPPPQSPTLTASPGKPNIINYRESLKTREQTNERNFFLNMSQIFFVGVKYTGENLFNLTKNSSLLVCS